MTQLCLPRPKALAYPIPVPLRGLGAGEGSHSPVGPCMSPWGPSVAQLRDSVLGLGAQGLTAGWPSLAAAGQLPGPDLLHWLSVQQPGRPAGPPQTLLPGGPSQGAALLPAAAVTGRLGPQEALLLALLGLGLLLGARGVPLALLGLPELQGPFGPPAWAADTWVCV
ncbi:uncharacterized protein C20orf141 homolog [Neomonachus schauinslandi]|uniref:Uncharacterized protein C20orf141 homolog n=1 Tax=Neomonachus schauinslandi TaxID=29088 RepID=A0A2Y9H6U1_NEOSC|nr:uncharacterized protein C20orf141 homolog [Neomonachus schauinslandi]